MRNLQLMKNIKPEKHFQNKKLPKRLYLKSLDQIKFEEFLWGKTLLEESADLQLPLL